MWDLFKTETLRFRRWALATAAVQLLVLAFMTRVIDLAQQPDLVYGVVAALYALIGLLFGLYQIGGYRRPSAWLSLLHRPLPHWRVAAALFGAGALLLLVGILLPLLVIAGWQEVMTARVLDTRHLWLALSGLLVALCGYLAGGYAMLGHQRYGAGALVLLALLVGSHASGAGAIALQVLALAWLAAMIVFAFKPDLSVAPRSLPGLVATALPLQMGLCLALILFGQVAALLWTLQGTISTASPAAGGETEANRAEGRELMLAGLAASPAAEARLWREQLEVSKVFQIRAQIPRTPTRHELTNVMPMEFEDDTRRLRWVFSHDSMRFEGYRLTDLRAVGPLGVAGNGAFPTPPLPGPEATLISRATVYQYDSETQRVLPRAVLPAGETITGFGVLGERIALLSDHALYVYDGRGLQSGEGVVTPRQRVPLPGKTGNLERIDLVEMLDGYLISFLFTRVADAGGSPARQHLLRVDGQNRVTPVARRDIGRDLPVALRYQAWYASPLLHAARSAAVGLFAGYAPARDSERQPVPRSAVISAAALLLLSLLGAIGYLRRTDLSLRARIAWGLACGVIGVPALLSLWLLHPARERIEDAPRSEADYRAGTVAASPV